MSVLWSIFNVYRWMNGVMIHDCTQRDITSFKNSSNCSSSSSLLSLWDIATPSTPSANESTDNWLKDKKKRHLMYGEYLKMSSCIISKPHVSGWNGITVDTTPYPFTEVHYEQTWKHSPNSGPLATFNCISPSSPVHDICSVVMEMTLTNARQQTEQTPPAGEC